MAGTALPLPSERDGVESVLEAQRFTPREVAERLNHLFATGDPNPIIAVTRALSLYTCDLIGPRECRFGRDAIDHSAEELRAFAASGGRFQVDFMDASVTDQAGSWVFQARTQDGRLRLCSLSIHVDDEGTPKRFLLLSSRMKAGDHNA